MSATTFALWEIGWLVQNFGLLNARLTSIAISGIEAILGDTDTLLSDITSEIRISEEVILSGVEDLIFNFEDGVNTNINDNITNSFNTYNDVVEGIGNGLGGLINKSRDVIGGAVDNVSGALGSLIARIEEVLERAIERLFEVVGSAIDAAVNAIRSAAEAVFNAIGDAVRGAVDAISEVGRNVIENVRDVVESIRDTLAEAFRNIQDFIGDLITKASDILSSVGDKLGEIADTIVGKAEEILGAITEGIEGAIDGLFEAADSAFELVRKGLSEVQEAIIAAGQLASDLFETHVATPIAEAALTVADSFKNVVMSIFEAIDRTFEDAIRSLFDRIGFPDRAARRYIEILESVFPLNPIMQFVVVVTLVIRLSTSLADVPIQMASQVWAQDLAPDFPFALATPSDLQQQTLLGITEDGDAIDTLRRAGFSEQEANRQLAQRRRIPDIGIVQTWFLREFVSEADALSLLQSAGLSQEDAENALLMSFFIPPVADLITMAVREVFSPDVAERFGQFEDFPEDFERFAAQQGISPEWARNYWAAHWALPSVQMGFEMLHRRVISEDDLNLLLRAQDIMPFWRDKLTQISFRPLTRVDVRRMHDLGLISDSELVDRYKDLGYDQENAEFMRDFTIAFNAPPETETPEELERLSRNAVLSLFSDGAITEPQTNLLLRELGIGSAAASIFIEVEKINAERSDREDQKSLVLERAQAGILTFGQAEDALGALGLEPVELERALTKLAREQARATRLPSRANLDKMLTAGIIEPTEYLLTMQTIGYAPIWAERFLSLVRSET